jgi:uncharacterized membrane protein
MKPWLLVSFALVILAVASSLAVYANRDEWLPEVVPTHWDADGVPDKETPRDEMLVPLLLVPGTMALMIGLALAIPWLSPIRYRVEPFRATYDYIMALVVAMFAGMHAVALLGYTQHITAVDRWITGVSLVCIMALGNVLGKVQPNFFVGVRTPWTIASEAVWIGTHRMAAWAFVAGGVVGLALLVAGAPALVAMSSFGAFAISPVFYSLWLYKRLEKRGRLGEQQ